MSYLLRIFLITSGLFTVAIAADVTPPDPPRPGDDGPIRPPLVEPAVPPLVDPQPGHDGIGDPGRNEGLRPRPGVPEPTPGAERPVEDAGGILPESKPIPVPQPPGSASTSNTVPPAPKTETPRPGLVNPKESSADPQAGPPAATVPPAADKTPQPGFVAPDPEPEQAPR